MTGTIAITMAGLGSRFREAGHTRPKYEIVVGGRPLFDWSMMSLAAFREAGWAFSFAARGEEEPQPFIKHRCEALGIRMADLIELDAPTDGQATTALYLAERAEPSLPFAIFNIDTFVCPGAMDPGGIAPDAAGWIPCFPGPGDSWSFARTDPDGRVLELREKTRISPHATLGFYWFASAALYRRLYRDFFAAGAGTEKGERYVAPMYNRLIADGEFVTISEVPLEQVGMLGTPEQVESFRQAPPPGAQGLFLGES